MPIAAIARLKVTRIMATLVHSNRVDESVVPINGSRIHVRQRRSSMVRHPPSITPPVCSEGALAELQAGSPSPLRTSGDRKKCHRLGEEIGELARRESFRDPRRGFLRAIDRQMNWDSAGSSLSAEPTSAESPFACRRSPHRGEMRLSSIASPKHPQLLSGSNAAISASKKSTEEASGHSYLGSVQLEIVPRFFLLKLPLCLGLLNGNSFGGAKGPARHETVGRLRVV